MSRETEKRVYIGTLDQGGYSSALEKALAWLDLHRSLLMQRLLYGRFVPPLGEQERHHRAKKKPPRTGQTQQ